MPLYLDLIAPSVVERPGVLIALVLVIVVFVVVMALIRRRRK